MSAKVGLAELLHTIEWLSSGVDTDNQAFLDRESGRIHWVSADSELDEDEVPDDLDDESRYLPEPDKRDLDLGRELATRFVAQHLPDAYDAVRDIFRRSGAYGRFKALLEPRGQLQAWYAFEAQEVEAEVRAWCADNGLELAP